MGKGLNLFPFPFHQHVNRRYMEIRYMYKKPLVKFQRNCKFKSSQLECFPYQFVHLRYSLKQLMMFVCFDGER